MHAEPLLSAPSVTQDGVYPVAVQMWFADGVGWAFCSSLSEHDCQMITRVVSGRVISPAQMAEVFTIPIGTRRLLCERYPDLDCLDLKACDRNPYVLRCVILPANDDAETDSDILALLKLQPLPVEKGRSETLAIHDPQATLRHLRNQITTIESYLNSRTITVGLLGARNSGKTTLLLSWYFFRVSSEYGFTISFDEDALAYLRPNAEFLLNTGATLPTDKLDPEEIVFTVSRGAESWTIRTIDFKGEYLAATRERSEEMKAARSQLASSEAIIVLYDPLDATGVGLLDAIDICLRDKARFVILAITKFDVCHKLPVTNDEVNHFVTNTSRLVQIKDKLAKHAKEGSRIIGLSAQGRQFTKGAGSISIDDIKPWNNYCLLQLLINNRQEELEAHRALLREKELLADRVREIVDARSQREQKRDAEAQRKALQESRRLEESRVRDEEERRRRTAEAEQKKRDELHRLETDRRLQEEKSIRQKEEELEKRKRESLAFTASLESDLEGIEEEFNNMPEYEWLLSMSFADLLRRLGEVNARATSRKVKHVNSRCTELGKRIRLSRRIAHIWCVVLVLAVAGAAIVRVIL